MNEHLSDFEIQRWSKDGPGENGPRLAQHLAECPECTKKYAAAVRQQPLSAEPTPNVDEFVAAGQRARQPQNLRWIGLAAAAVLVIVAAVSLLRNQAAPEQEIRLRGGSVEAVSPAGVVDSRKFEFVWASGVAAAGYRIEIGRGDKVIAFIDTKAPRLAAPPNLPPGDYWWRVNALNEAHQPLATSQRVAFSLRPR